MFKKSLLTLLALLATLQMSAAPVDVSAAKTKAEQYLASKVYAGKYMAPRATQATLIKTEMGDITKVPVYYIFNTATTFVIVSGDDRAEDILAYGDKPLNLDRIPDGLKYLMDCYKEQLDWLISNPTAEVEKASNLLADGAKATTYGPLLTCNWGQEGPYWNQCIFTYKRKIGPGRYKTKNYQCLTGCPATSAAMVLYYWKYPTEVDGLDSYTAQLGIGYDNSLPVYVSQSPYVTYTYPALPDTTFDWDNMKDNYGTWYDEDGTEQYESYTADEGDAVATLMRYVGQAEEMEYGISDLGSGIPYSKADNIVNMFETFGYKAQLVEKEDYTEAAWANALKKEMAAGRPVVYLGSDNMVGGHAFNVDGYDGTNKYHINWGWSGEGNAWCEMNAFTGRDITFNVDQKMIIGIKPNVGIPGDVNGDGEVNIADINALIDILLTGNTSSPNYGRADVNGDGEVNIADVNEVINIVLRS